VEDMPESFDVLFASSNRNKFNEAKKILSQRGIKLGFLKSTLEEIQSDSIEDIAKKKVSEAYNQCKKPVIVEDDGLFIESLNGFPGPYSSFVFKTIGNNGILKLVGKNRTAKFHSTISYCNKKNKVKLFSANVNGKISKKIEGKGWGYDPIFIPSRNKNTYAMIKNKNEISHRYLALRKFSNWFLNKQESLYR
jgi:XTP/dITP diphosphohydrolase